MVINNTNSLLPTVNEKLENSSIRIYAFIEKNQDNQELNKRLKDLKENIKKKTIFIKSIRNDYNSSSSIMQVFEKLVKDFTFLASSLEEFNKDQSSNTLEFFYQRINELNILADKIYIESLSFVDTITENVIKNLIDINEKSKETLLNKEKLDHDINILNEKVADSLKKQKELENDIHKKFTDTSDFLNQQGLSKSFFDRANDLSKYGNFWLVVIIVLMFFVVSIEYQSLQYFMIYDIKNIQDVQMILWKYLLFSPLAITIFWVLWFASKKYFYYSRLEDNYNFKNDLSKAYYGYAKEAISAENENDKLIRGKLLQGVLANICQNPVNNLPIENNSPYAELLSKLIDKIAQTSKKGAS